MLRKFLEKADGLREAILKPINTALISVLGLYTLVWGLWVASPFWVVFHHYTPGDGFLSVSLETFELSAGLVAMLVGYLIIRGALGVKYKQLVTGALAGFYFWTLASFMYFFSHWESTGGPTAIFIAIYCAFVYVNHKVNRKLLS